MKNILTTLKALASRGAFRSTLTAIALAGASLFPTGRASAGYDEYKGTVIVTVLTEAGDRTVSHPARLRIHDGTRVTLMTTDGLLKNGTVIIDTGYDWSGWQWAPAMPGFVNARSRTYRGETSYSLYLKNLRVSYGLAGPELLWANEVCTYNQPTDGMLSQVASSYNPSKLKSYDLAVGTTLTLLQQTNGKVGMILTKGSTSDLSSSFLSAGVFAPRIAGRAASVNFIPN